MKYLSVCSGIEAATVAWHPLGWTPVGFSEIEAFPSAVLAHHYPDIPNYGDMTQHEQWPIERGAIDLLVGGTPCQSFSVAGLRKGLKDPRGGLMLTYLEIAQRLRPRWVVWENVPGVLSSNGGRDFGSFLGALGELGYGWAYRVLDAQWCRTHRHPRAVPQRRRRVFVVGCLGDGDAAAAVLFERESVRRDTAARRATGQGSAADAEGGAGAGCYWNGEQIAAALTRKGCDDRMPDKERLFAVLQPSVWPADCAGTLGQASAGTGAPGYSNQEIFSQNCANLVPQPVPFRKSKRAQSASDDESWVRADQANTLNGFDTGERDTHAVAYPIDTQNMTEGHASGGLGFGHAGDPSFTVTKGHSHAVAFSCKDHGADAGTAAPTLRAMGHGESHANGGGQVAVAHAFYSTGGTHGVNQHPEVSPAVKVGSGLGIPSPPAVAHAMTVRRLTPRECERLQGFPDDYTAIPWRKKGADECPDGPRYKAIGNSMAVNCMEWIGERIAAREAARGS